MKSSQYSRPSSPPHVQLQRRDREIARSLARFGHLTADHLRWLHFPTSRSSRTAQQRLRLLWANRLLDRVFLPFVLSPANDGPRRVKPIYRLARSGAGLVPGAIRPAGAGGRIEHDLIAADLLLSARAAMPERFDAVPEAELWPRLRAYRAKHPETNRLIAPDGVLRISGTEQRIGIPIEIVRADPRGGISGLLAKLHRYAAQVHDGTLQKMLGVDRLRCILLVLPTPVRAANIRERIATLAHGRQLMWVTATPPPHSRTSPPLTFTPATVFDHVWRAGDGKAHTLREVLESVPARPGSPGAS